MLEDGQRTGLALQLCALRYPGRLLSSDEVIPEKVLRFIAAQLGLTGDDVLPYASRRQTRQQHGVDSGRGQNDTLRKLLVGVPVEPIGFFHQ